MSLPWYILIKFYAKHQAESYLAEQFDFIIDFSDDVKKDG